MDRDGFVDLIVGVHEADVGGAIGAGGSYVAYNPSAGCFENRETANSVKACAASGRDV